MSESDDTDVLLLIPPDIFHVPSPDSESSSSDLVRTNCGKTSVISELVEHMQSLESRISAIESRDNSLDVSALNNSLDSHGAHSGTCHSYYRQTLPRTKFSVSQGGSLQNSPVKPRQSLSVPATPSGRTSQTCTNSLGNDMRSGRCSLTASIAKPTTTTTNTLARAKHDAVTSFSDSYVVPPSASCGIGLPHATATSARKESHLSLRSNDYCASQQHTRTRIVQEMELSEVDELLQEMEATELELAKRINSTGGYKYHNEPVQSVSLTRIADSMDSQEKETQLKLSGTNRRLDFQSCNKESQSTDVLSAISQKKCAFPDMSLPYSDSFHLDETDKMISEFKTWEQSVQQSAPRPNGCTTESVKNTDHLSNVLSATIVAKPKEPKLSQSNLCTNETSSAQIQSKSSTMRADPVSRVTESIKLADFVPTKAVQYSNTDHLLDLYKVSQRNENLHDDKEKYELSKNSVHVGTNTDPQLRKCQRLLSLSDFWDTNPTRLQEETLRIKLEEEKFRREHCEQLIQELQKRLLEQQEKVAVAIRVDNDKNVLISQFHTAWSKLKQQVEILETEHRSSQTNLQNVTEKHQSEVAEFQSQIKRLERELSKALDLAAGYKEKSDTTTKEKIDLLKTHADELESYKSLVQEAENRYEQMKIEFNALLEKNQQKEETLRAMQSELSKERFRETEVRNEMGLIRKALDTCEAELIVLKQEKEHMQLKLKEEISRNSILEQKNSSLLVSIDDAKKAEKLAKDEIKSVAEQKENIRAELQEVYQKQVDEVVKAKLQEFQMQLDTAESEFLEEMKTRQQVIAECAARKIKDVIDKHHLEINLLEEKHKEEKRLYELQLAQALQKSSILETHLNSQRATKSQLAEQLHSVMQKQWQQALHIISGGNTDNLAPIQKIHADKSFDLIKGPVKSESMPNCYTKLSQEPIRYVMQSLEAQTPIAVQPLDDQNESAITMNSIENTPLTSRNSSKDDLRKYVKMVDRRDAASERRYHKVQKLHFEPTIDVQRGTAKTLHEERIKYQERG
ncbi:serine/threonine-protein kinase dst2 isoform X3 [Odontomachus brunneus]|uniref:serine/threonine-protein kinase dst2 isoform X3 n=1 Tax=Odontomachus brunneus TaxID=486640 RepID=UPI0013F1BD86|nr:serine/threonine-protein kinase dst2 isoform X3 [Odontomachus brunneus]